MDLSVKSLLFPFSNNFTCFDQILITKVKIAANTCLIQVKVSV